jgi:hypothetical protein
LDQGALAMLAALVTTDGIERHREWALQYARQAGRVYVTMNPFWKAVIPLMSREDMVALVEEIVAAAAAKTVMGGPGQVIGLFIELRPEHKEEICKIAGISPDKVPARTFARTSSTPGPADLGARPDPPWKKADAGLFQVGSFAATPPAPPLNFAMKSTDGHKPWNTAFRT